jgi:hypothetical protein
MALTPNIIACFPAYVHTRRVLHFYKREREEEGGEKEESRKKCSLSQGNQIRNGSKAVKSILELI